MKMFRSAGTAEIIRAHQKDDNFLNHLRSLVADVFQRISGPRTWIRWRKNLDIAADLAYFFLTTCSELQTVGEEYVNIIQTDKSLRILPRRWRRVLMVILQVCAPYIFLASLEKFEQQLRSSASLPLKPATREALLGILPLVKKAASVIHRLHLATFYINGIFYHLAKRLTGIQYIQYMSRAHNSSSVKPFQILGYISSVQVFSSLLLHLVYLGMALYNQKQSSQITFTDRGSDVETETMGVLLQDKCPLCLARRQKSTLTPCGHLYCWKCIHEWYLSKQECPLCREQFPPHRLIVLQNYDAT